LPDLLEQPPQVVPEAVAANVCSVYVAVLQFEPTPVAKSSFATAKVPSEKPAPNVKVTVLVAAIPVGVINFISWSARVFAAKRVKLSDREVMLAACAIRVPG